MAGYNHCTFIGNLGRDPEIRYTHSGIPVVATSIAVSEKYKGEEKTEWVKIVFWNKLAEIVAQYCGKGSTILVAGRLQTREWEDEKGEKHNTTEIVANEMKMLGGKKKDGAEVPAEAAPEQQPGDDSDIPF